MAETGSLDTAPQWARELLDTEPVGHLGLLDDNGHPRVLPITFAALGGEVFSAVDDKPKRVAADELARVRWLRARPDATLTVDRYDDDWARLAWVQLLVRAEIVAAAGHESAMEALAARYPAYRRQAPGGPLLRLTPTRVLWWRAKNPHAEPRPG